MKSGTSPIKQAQQLIDKFGGEIDDYFKFWPNDKSYFFASDGQSFLAYGLKHRVAVCTFDPVGPAKSVTKLLQEFKQFCQQRHWQYIFIQTTDKYDASFERIAAKRLTIGADACISTEQFNTQTVHNKYFRNIVNRFHKAGYRTLRYLPPHSPDLLVELKQISDDWLRIPHHEEWQFLTGRFDEDYLQGCPLFVLRDRLGAAQAFVTELPSYKSGVASIDLIRHFRSALPNSIDFLLTQLLQLLEEDGVPDFNLGLSPLAGEPYMHTKTDRFILWFYATFQSFMRFKGLHRFKAKYRPTWEPRYIYLGSSLSRLPQIGLAIVQLMGRYRPATENPAEDLAVEPEPQPDRIA